MAYWCGAAFGFGVALFFIGLGAIPAGDAALTWLKWGGAVIALAGCIGAYFVRRRAGSEPSSTPPAG